jgi:hypothetical protein
MKKEMDERSARRNHKTGCHAGSELKPYERRAVASHNPRFLRTHPPKRDRIARLPALKPEAAPRILGPMSEALPTRFRAMPSGPRWRTTGLWY